MAKQYLVQFYTTPIGNFIQYCSVRVSLYVLDLDYDSRMSPILLVVEITYQYDFGLRIETGTESPLLLYIMYKCIMQYSTQLVERSGKYIPGTVAGRPR